MTSTLHNRARLARYMPTIRLTSLLIIEGFRNLESVKEQLRIRPKVAS